MSRFTSVRDSLNMSRFADPHNPENNISMRDAERLVAMFINMKFQPPDVYCGSNRDGGRGLPFSEMRNIGANEDFPIDIRIMLPGNTNEQHASEIARMLNKPNWEAFVAAVTLLAPPSRKDELTDIVGYAFQNFPSLEINFKEAFSKLVF